MKKFIERYQSIAPDFFSMLEGTSTALIDRFEISVGRVLPTDYREFLSTMGVSRGHNSELILYRAGRRHLDFGMETVLSFGTKKVGAALPKRIKIGVEDGSVGDDVYLDYEIPTAPPRVVIKETNGAIRLWFDDFQSALFTMGFVTFHMNPLPQKSLFVIERNDARDAIPRIAAALKFLPVPLVGSRTHAYLTASSGLFCHDNGEGPLVLYTASHQDTDQENVAKVIASELEMRSNQAYSGDIVY